MGDTAKNVVVLIPGTTGSNLISSRDQSNIWPTKVLENVFVSGDIQGDPNFKNAINFIEDKTVPLLPGTIMTEIDVKNPINQNDILNEKVSYQGFIDFFNDGSNFSDGSGYTAFYPNYEFNSDSIAVVDSILDNSGQAINNADDRILVCMGYDWRQDNTQSAALLQNVLSNIDSKLDGEDYNIYLVAHSMGGLLARYYLEVLNENIKDSWYTKIKLLITLATPHLGAPLALSAISGQLPAFAGIISDANFAEVFVDDQTFPSSFELLPPVGDNFVEVNGNSVSIWNDDNGGINSLLIKGNYINSKNKPPIANPNSDIFDEANTFITALKTDNVDNYRYVFAVNSGDTVTEFTLDTSQTPNVLSPISTESGGDTIVPIESSINGESTDSSNLYQAETNDPNVNSDQPWTQGEPKHGNLPGRTDVLAQVVTWISEVI